MKYIQIRNEKIKLVVVVDEMISYIENPKDSTKKLLKLLNKFSKVVGDKLNIQKSATFLYIENELSERKAKKTIPFKISSKRINYLGIT